MSEGSEPGGEEGSPRAGLARLGTDFGTRLVSGLIMAALAVGALMAGPAAFNALVLVLALLLSWEWARLVHGRSAEIVIAVHIGATALAVGAYILLVPTAMHPWYVLWAVPFLCARPSWAALFFSGVVTLSYTQYLVKPETLPWWAWLAQYGPLYALVWHDWCAGRFGPAGVTGRAADPRAVATGAPRATGVLGG